MNAKISQEDLKQVQGLEQGVYMGKLGSDGCDYLFVNLSHAKPEQLKAFSANNVPIVECVETKPHNKTTS